MDDQGKAKNSGPRVFVYRGTLPPALGLLLLVPFAFLFLSFAAVLFAGGALATLVLPIFLRHRLSRKTEENTEGQAIELERDEYTRVEPTVRQLPPK